MSGDSIEVPVRKVICRHDAARPGPEELASCKLTPFPRSGTNPMLQGDAKGRRLLFKFYMSVRGHVPDFCEREEFVSVIGKFLGIPVVNAWVVNSGPLNTVELLAGGDGKPDRCVAMEFLQGTTLCDDKSGAGEIVLAHPEWLGDLFAFMHWVGDEDRGLTDTMLVEDRIILIDNGLCGPGRSGILRSAHPLQKNYLRKPEALVKMCYPGKPSLVAFVLRDLKIPALSFKKPEMLERIKTLPDGAIQEIVEAVGLQRWVADTLVLRRDLPDPSYLDGLGKAAGVCGY